MIYVLGGGGFIGSAIVDFFYQKNINCVSITKKNYLKFKNTKCEILINANGNSKKYLAEENPSLDFELSVQSVSSSLNDFIYKKYVFLSSSDVYSFNNFSQTDENTKILSDNLTKYGLHKYLSEILVKNMCSNWLILRLGGFIGKNMMKNPIFDMLNNSPLRLNLNSEFQFMNTNTLAKVINDLLTQNVKNEVFNVSGQNTVKLLDIYKMIKSKSIYKENDPIININLDLNKIKKRLHDQLPTSENEINNYLKII